MINPTPGRVLWFYASLSHAERQPQAAMVAYVHHERSVNLMLLDENGDSRPMQRVPLVQEGDNPPDTGPFVTWMPYQREQAAKHARSEQTKDEPSSSQAVGVLASQVSELKARLKDQDEAISALSEEIKFLKGEKLRPGAMTEAQEKKAQENTAKTPPATPQVTK